MNISREERKNLAVIKLIERQERQKNKREEKKKLQTEFSSKVTLTLSRGPQFGKVAPNQQMVSRQKKKLQIKLLFADKQNINDPSQRYFFKRKQSIEKSQKPVNEWIIDTRYPNHYDQPMLGCSSMAYYPLDTVYYQRNPSRQIEQQYTTSNNKTGVVANTSNNSALNGTGGGGGCHNGTTDEEPAIAADQSSSQASCLKRQRIDLNGNYRYVMHPDQQQLQSIDYVTMNPAVNQMQSSYARNSGGGSSIYSQDCAVNGGSIDDGNMSASFGSDQVKLGNGAEGGAVRSPTRTNEAEVILNGSSAPVKKTDEQLSQEANKIKMLTKQIQAGLVTSKSKASCSTAATVNASSTARQEIK